MMTGILKVGTGAGQLFIPMIASVLIVDYGWNNSYIIIGIIVMLLLIIIGQLLRRDPTSMELLPDGNTMTQTTRPEAVETGYYPHEVLKTQQFWTICVAYFTTMYTLQTIMLHIVPHATDMRISGTLAASVLSVIGGTSMVGRFVIGTTIDRIGSKSSMVICLVLVSSALLWLQFASELWMLYLFAIVHGFSHGGLYTVISPIVAEYFGLLSHGILFGIVFFIAMVGGATGPVITGYIFDITTSYSLAFWICTASTAVSLGLILSLRPIRKDKEIIRGIL
jgi:MFS family permease